MAEVCKAVVSLGTTHPLDSRRQCFDGGYVINRKGLHISIIHSIASRPKTDDASLDNHDASRGIIVKIVCRLRCSIIRELINIHVSLGVIEHSYDEDS
eukprot:scaffold361_cov265-Chaetoceros_neogracile.AAC.30